MSASTVAITANPAVNNNPSLALGSRRRTVSVTEKRSSNVEMVTDGGSAGGFSEHAVANGKDHSNSTRGGEATVVERPRDLTVVTAKKGAVANSTVSPRRKKGGLKPPEKPLWLTVISVFTKNFLLLLVVLGLVQMIRKLAVKHGSGDGATSPYVASEFEARIAEVEAFLKKTMTMIQVQVEVVDRKIENEVGGLRRELDKKVEEKGLLFENALKKLEEKTEGLDQSMSNFRSTDFLMKKEFERFLDELRNSRSDEERNKDWSLDEIRALAREIVEKEIERHAADGLGRADYALASAGASVVAHSESYFSSTVRNSMFGTKGQNNVHSYAIKMLQPSFGEPGQCFPLKGSSGFVEIRLRTAIIPEAVTLEHVAKSVAYDQSSAPKDCRIFGWYKGSDANPSSQAGKKFLLGEFTYDLERSNAQTFNVDSTDSGIINMVRMEVASNFGAAHTCIYRLRVHGHEPDSVAVSTL